MLICGLNITHDSAVAVIDGNRLLMSTEGEKIGSGVRHADMPEIEQVESILESEGIRLRDIDQFVISGWISRPGEALSALKIWQSKQLVRVPLAPYTDSGPQRELLYRYDFTAIPDGPFARGYSSYTHASNHVAAAYCSSPFAARGQDAYVVAWDGMMVPRLYHVAPRPLNIQYLGPLFPVMGEYFVEFCVELDPFIVSEEGRTREECFRVRYETPGKAMAYAALGETNPDAYKLFDSLLASRELQEFVHTPPPLGEGTLPGTVIVNSARAAFPDMSSADLIATFQEYLGMQLVNSLTRMLRGKINGDRPRLCLSGGCALNIKWNSMIRRTELFSEVWAPPFPNDSGAALGMACCEMMHKDGAVSMDWDVYSGPRVDSSSLPRDWAARPCDEAQLAKILHEENEPVVVLYGRAELGPRALGNRSILAPAVHAGMKDRLNEIKRRASYRPVAPLCLESRAHEVFDPGCPDPYMLFEHRVRPAWRERIPAVLHLDGTARLQTIRQESANTAAGRILREYEKLSGIPVLCNTSANLPGHGFFQHARSASDWGRTRYVWAEGTLYTNPRFLMTQG
jgi:carbamoyltransferase